MTPDNAAQRDLPEAERLARQFHEAYERLAPKFHYATRPASRMFDPESSNGQLMIAVCAELLASRASAGAPEGWRPIESDQFEAHIKTTAWYAVLSQEAKHNTEDAAVFRMARMAAEVAWNAALDASRPAVQQEGWEDMRHALNEAWRSLETVSLGAGRYEHMTEADEVRGYAESRARVAKEALDAAMSPETPRPEDVSQKAGKDATYWHDRYCTEKKERKDWQERAELAEKALIDKTLEAKP